MKLDELEKLADGEQLIVTMATQHLKALIALCRMQHDALVIDSDWMKDEAIASYEEFNK